MAKSRLRNKAKKVWNKTHIAHQPHTLLGLILGFEYGAVCYFSVSEVTILWYCGIMQWEKPTTTYTDLTPLNFGLLMVAVCTE